MVFCRLLTNPTQINSWLKNPPNAEKLVGGFSPPKPATSDWSDISVFSASTRVDESENAVAAFHRASSDKFKNGIVSIRITARDLAQFNITRAPSMGNTGIGIVDKRHYDLSGTKEDFTRLALDLYKKSAERSSVVVPLSVGALLTFVHKLKNSATADRDAQRRLNKVLEGTIQDVINGAPTTRNFGRLRNVFDTYELG